MLPMKRGRGRPPKDPAVKHRGLNVSLPPTLIKEIGDMAAERRVPIAVVVREFIERGLVEHQVLQMRERREVA